MTLVGFERVGVDDVPGATWIIPGSVSANQLEDIHSTVLNHRNNPVMSYGEENPIAAAEMIRRKPANKAPRAEYDDDSDNGGLASSADEDFLFPSGGLAKKNPKSEALKDLKEARRRRKNIVPGEDTGISNETQEARRKSRLQADIEKINKIKRAEFVYSSDEVDEEADGDFFAREEQRGKGQAAKVMKVLKAGLMDAKTGKKRKSGSGEGAGRKKTKLAKLGADSVSEEDDTDHEIGDGTHSDDTRSSSPISRIILDESEDQEDETPQSTPTAEWSYTKALQDASGNSRLTREDVSKTKDSVAYQDGEKDDDDEDAITSAIRRRRGRLAQIIDSDSE